MPVTDYLDLPGCRVSIAETDLNESVEYYMYRYSLWFAISNPQGPFPLPWDSVQEEFEQRLAKKSKLARWLERHGGAYPA